jgi:FkbM family methyltransferase
MGAVLDKAWTAEVGFPVHLRPDTADAQVAADTFTGRYHIPPVPLTPRTVLDCGANIGLTCAHYQQLWPDAQIIGIEPDDGNASAASHNYNGQIVRCAVSVNNGFASLRRSDLATDGYRLTTESQGNHVRCCTLEHLISLYLYGGHCDFLKLDIEGEEARVLPDHEMWAPLVDAVLVECHEQVTGYGWRDAVEDLKRAGFRPRRHRPHPQAVFAQRRR